MIGKNKFLKESRLNKNFTDLLDQEWEFLKIIQVKIAKKKRKNNLEILVIRIKIKKKIKRKRKQKNYLKSKKILLTKKSKWPYKTIHKIKKFKLKEAKNKGIFL